MLPYTFVNINKLKSIRHAVFTRRGGVSRRPFDSLNLATAAGDSLANVSANFDKLRAYWDTPCIISLKQTHSDLIIVVDENNRDLLNTPEPTVEGDALVTTLPRTVLMVKVADCQPILLGDPVKKVVAAVHAGWRGSVQDIIGKTIGVMQSKFGSKPTDIQAGIGPSLGPCCAEFVNYREELPATFRPYKSGEHHFNFWQISVMQMKAAGIPESNIAISGFCTVCNPDLFYSYRRDKLTGRFGAAITLMDC